MSIYDEADKIQKETSDKRKQAKSELEATVKLLVSDISKILSREFDVAKQQRANFVNVETGDDGLSCELLIGRTTDRGMDKSGGEVAKFRAFFDASRKLIVVKANVPKSKLDKQRDIEVKAFDIAVVEGLLKEFFVAYFEWLRG